MLQVDKIEKSFPKTWELLRKWATDGANAMIDMWQKEMPSDDAGEIDYIPLLTNEQMYGLIIYYPRRLYDFFDENDVFVEIGIHSITLWDWSVATSKASSVQSGSVKSRIEAEYEGFSLAFKLLEEKL